MKVRGKEIPCGCDSRRDIMFTQGGLTAKDIALYGVVLVAVGSVLYLAGRKVA